MKEGILKKIGKDWFDIKELEINVTLFVFLIVVCTFFIITFMESTDNFSTFEIEVWGFMIIIYAIMIIFALYKLEGFFSVFGLLAVAFMLIFGTVSHLIYLTYAVTLNVILCYIIQIQKYLRSRRKENESKRV